jgi:hypothetical protein
LSDFLILISFTVIGVLCFINENFILRLYYFTFCIVIKNDTTINRSAKKRQITYLVPLYSLVSLTWLHTNICPSLLNFPQVASVQSSHHQCQCIVDDDIQVDSFYWRNDRAGKFSLLPRFVRCCMLSGWLEMDPVACFCQHDNEPSGSIKEGGFTWWAEWPSV